ncbi:GntR family transcriptional regulator [Gluconobacter roseus]|uniref:GntR family transcriptional regulator n=1 Tax=Gluconobacter roseus TaxID=586239 RepID=UPI0038D2370C
MTATDTRQTSSPAPTRTKQQDPRYEDSDLWPPTSIRNVMAEAHMTVTAVVCAAVSQMNDVATATLSRLRAGGRLFYVGAGTSGRVGLQDGVEDPEDTASKEILSHNSGRNNVVFGIAALAELTGVLRVTVRKALEQLVTAGLLTQRPSAGTFDPAGSSSRSRS